MSFTFKKLQICLTQLITLHVYIPPKIIYSSLYRKNKIKSIKAKAQKEVIQINKTQLIRIASFIASY